jgi:hypothetical protein
LFVLQYSPNMKIFIGVLTLCIFLFFNPLSMAQVKDSLLAIELLNPSFEHTGNARTSASFLPKGWETCNFEGETLVIRVKRNKKLAKRRIAYLYAYAFEHAKMPASRLDFRPYSSKDEAFYWAFENDDLCLGFFDLNFKQ